MIKVAFNKENPKLVFTAESKTRVAVGNAGVKEYYVGTLLDYSTDPVTVKESHKEQVTAFDSKWQECPVEITEADEDSAESGGDDTEPGGEDTTFDLDLKYSDEPNQGGVYQLILIPDELVFNEDLVNIVNGEVFFNNHVHVELENVVLDPAGFYVVYLENYNGYVLMITDENAIAVVTENGGFEGLTISINADAGIATLDNATSNAFEIEFVYGEDLPNSAYPGDYIPESTSEGETEPEQS